MAFPGIGTAVNVLAVLVGSSLGLLLGARLPTRTRDTVTDALGLVTLLIGALSAAEVRSAGLVAAVGSAAPVLVVLGAMLIGGIAGSLLNIEARLEGFGGWLRTRLDEDLVDGDNFPRKSRHVRAGLHTFPRERPLPILRSRLLPAEGTHQSLVEPTTLPASGSSKASLPLRWSFVSAR